MAIWKWLTNLATALFGGGAWIPLISLSALVVIVGLAIQQDWVPREFTGKILGFEEELVVVAAIAGFLGSFVRVLNRAVQGDYQELAVVTKALYALMRPLAGAMLGLFMLAVFG